MAPSSFSDDYPSKTICVMDASGPLGSALVHRLLHKGYTVHAAVQSHGDLQSFRGCDEKLRTFRADPFDYHSIMDALEGCCGLFYCFEPPLDQPTYDEFMAEVEVRAAHNVLEACAQTETINKVVFTSSVTAIVWGDNNNNSNSEQSHDLDERNWSDITLCRKFKLWHALSKTLAEKTAWALAMDRDITMVSINGGLLMAPDLTVTNPYLKGAAEMYEDGVFVTVDLSFIVDAHICVFEDISSYGRYICFNHVINSNDDAVELARMLSPPSETSPSSVEDARVYQQRISNQKLNKLMVDSKRELQVDWSTA